MNKTNSKTSFYGNNGFVKPSKSGYYADAPALDRDAAGPKRVTGTDLRTKRSSSGKKSY